MTDSRSPPQIPGLGLLEAAPDAMIICGRDGRIAFANAQAEKLFGWGPVELLGQSLAVLMPERLRERHAVFVERFFEFPAQRPMGAPGLDLIGLRRDGAEFPVEISLNTLRTDDGLMAICAIRDISVRKQTEAAQEATNRELQAALWLVKKLTGVLPICSYCKKVRDEHGEWTEIELFIRRHSEAEFSHGVCPECAQENFPEFMPR